MFVESCNFEANYIDPLYNDLQQPFLLKGKAAVSGWKAGDLSKFVLKQKLCKHSALRQSHPTNQNSYTLPSL